MAEWLAYCLWVQMTFGLQNTLELFLKYLGYNTIIENALLHLEQANHPICIGTHFYSPIFSNHLELETDGNIEEAVVVGLDVAPIADWLNGEGLTNPGPDPEVPLPDRNK